jgi:cytochrome c oxidase subunit 2
MTRNPSILFDTAGPHAHLTAALFRFALWVDATVAALVLGTLLVALWRRRVATLTPPTEPTPGSERRVAKVVGAAVAATVVVLTIFVGASYAVDRRLVELDRDPALEIEVTAHQWWWEARYLDATPSRVFTTANELHVPTHETVRLRLRTSDVIHSFWVPNLAGKRDIIPGRDDELTLRAERDGAWQGRCAEFCGLQHAHMGLTIVSEPRPAFEAWQASQRAPAAEPRTAEESRGREVFVHGACAVCHVIRTAAETGFSDNAPDLTHLKSRGALGAGAAPNTKGHLGGWILDPHGIKPGVHMPTILQEPADFQALLAYLETLR